MMTEKKRLPEEWAEMSFDRQMMWMMDNYGLDEDDEHGQMLFDTASMDEEVHTAFKELTGLVY